MLGLDTNVLARYLLRDDRRRAEAARAAMADALAAGTPILISLLTLLETEWILRARAGLAKSEILAIFKRLLEARDVRFENEHVVEDALYAFENGGADFAECLMAAQYRHLGCETMLTFDAKAARLPGCRLVTAQ